MTKEFQRKCKEKRKKAIIMTMKNVANLDTKLYYQKLISKKCDYIYQQQKLQYSKGKYTYFMKIVEIYY